MTKIGILIFTLLCIGLSFNSHAQTSNDRTPTAIYMDVTASGVSVEGDVMFEKRTPASLVKIMTAYVIFDEIESGRLSLDDKIDVSKAATQVERTHLGLKQGKRQISVEQALYALFVRSANDVAYAVAEHVAGSEQAFAQMMNQKASDLGLLDTAYVDASGLSDSDEQITNAYDVALLIKSMVSTHPDFYERFFKAKSFWWNGKKYSLSSRNAAMKRFGADAMKTGFTTKAGHNIAFVEEGDEGEYRIFVLLEGKTHPYRRDWVQDVLATEEKAVQITFVTSDYLHN